jgi:8-oxo-dGTP pyrophosphatase MutT (NUDIX family)
MKVWSVWGQAEQVRVQYGALPFRMGNGIEILLITTRETQRWIIPKGWPMKGRRPRGAAAQEALEEAGVTGDIERRPCGAYLYTKRGFAGQSWLCKVEVFPLRVRKEREQWRERDQRTRRWFHFIEAADAVTEPGLRSLILAFGLAFEREQR